MGVPISNVTRRVVYAASGTGPYAFTFEILANTDIAVYRDDTLLTLTTNYTVTIASNGTGSITLVAAPTGATQIAIVGNRTIQRTTDFVTGGDFFANTINNEMDQQTIFAQQNAEGLARAMQAPQTDPTSINMTLPRASVRAGKYLSFDNSGNPVAAEGRTEVAAVYAIRDEIVTVAGIDDQVVAVAGNSTNINTVAGISSNVTTVAGISANVTTVAGNNANVTSVAGNAANINTVAGSIANVNNVGGSITSVNTVAGGLGTGQAVTVVAANLSGTNTVGTVAGSIANVNAVGANIASVNAVNSNATSITTVALNIANVNSVGGNIANVNSVAGNAVNINYVSGNGANINTVAGISSNVTTVAINNANVTTVAGISANVTSVAGNSTNINTVATDIANVNATGGNIANVTTVAGSIASVNTNATNIANINQNAANITAIQNASANATSAAASAATATTQATNAAASAAAASAVALGDEPVRPLIRPSLLLDFANTEQLDPRITFTRASAATYFDQFGVMQTAASGVARFDHNPTTFESLGLLIEESRTNQLTYSEQFDNAAWAKARASITANATVSPNGTVNADKLVEDTTASSTHQVIQSDSFTSGTAYTFTTYIKAAERTWVLLRLPLSAFTSTLQVYFNLSTGVVGTITANTTASITPVGNNWYRCSITATATTTASGSTGILLATADTSANYTGDGTSGIFIWGAQLEAGAFPTSYIPTVASQVTRAADAASMTGTNFSSWYNAGQGTLYSEASTYEVSTVRGAMSISDGTSTYRILTAHGTGARGFVANNGTQMSQSISSVAFTNNTFSKVSMAYADDNGNASANGTLGTLDTAMTIPVVTQLQIGTQAGNAAQTLNGSIKKLAYYPIRCTDAQLQALTTV